MKICVVCGVTFDPNGTKAICCSVECSKERKLEQERKWREQNRERVRERSRKYREQNCEQVNEASRKYHKRNREKLIEQHRKYYKQNRERLLEQKREYREQNREQIREYANEYGRKYYKQNLGTYVCKHLKHYHGIENPPESMVEFFTTLRIAKKRLKELTEWHGTIE